ncbi:enoyl-ACP reductase FabV [Methylovulum miyakonense]|uniref:enoyl-ACP reductase FabV n=1 Tax=Methylovulum miyakonense TaxID=645578 RepID=UPI000361C598|nr:enoyl-ACP reductase FabV [Methylovulum miyakonense]
MIIKPKVRGFICTNAHPQGCAAHVQEQIAYTKAQAGLAAKGDVAGPKNVLVIGCSTGYGLASRITAAFGYGAKTLGVCFEKPASDKTASPGYYNTSAFHDAATAEGLFAHTINGDAFSNDVKDQVIDVLKSGMGKVDLIVYSLASPRRTDPVTGQVYSSVLKPIGNPYTSKNLNTDTMKISEITLEPATEAEIANTVKVMGGEDWELWIDALKAAGLLADGVKTVAYTYLGDKLTWPIYGQATIGKAKEDLDRAATAIASKLQDVKGHANVAVLKALVTQASSAIPLMSLYLSILIKVMKAAGTDEHCIEQIQRLFTECLYSNNPRMDAANRYRVDEKELEPAIQAQVEAIWADVTEDNLMQTTDYKSYSEDFLKLFGFGFAGVDYDADISPQVATNF